MNVKCEVCSRVMNGSGCKGKFEINGKVFERVPFYYDGMDDFSGKAKCRDCGVIEGKLHHWGCDSEKCPVCNGQAGMGCDCKGKYSLIVENKKSKAEEDIEHYNKVIKKIEDKHLGMIVRSELSQKDLKIKSKAEFKRFYDIAIKEWNKRVSDKGVLLPA